MTAPLTITIRVFRSDAGWSYEVHLWTGNVDVSNDPTTRRYTSPHAYRSPTTAWNAGRTYADRMVRA